MLINYFKIAFRYLMKNRIFSLINIAGLSLSLACAMLMILYTKDELTFDRFHKEGESLYLITIDVRFPDGRRWSLRSGNTLTAKDAEGRKVEDEKARH